MKNLIRKILRKLRTGGVSTEERLSKYGFKHGDDFWCYSWEGIDSDYPWLITIGDKVTISTDVRILAHDASTNRAIGRTKIGVVNIGSNVFIGSGARILLNVRIGDNVVIGAGSVVTRDIPSNVIAVGNPARVIGTYDDFIFKNKISLMSHPTFFYRKRSAWKDASDSEHKEMREKLKDTYGYV